MSTTTLYLEVSDEIMERLFILARANDRPLNDQAIALLDEATKDRSPA